MLSSTIRQVLTQALVEACRQLTDNHPQVASLVGLESPHLKEHGDYASSVALSLAKILRQKPLDIATQLSQLLQLPDNTASVAVAAPGFINFTLHPAVKINIIREIQQQKNRYGANQQGDGNTILLEFISANPTGPLHIGHGRACVYGDCLGNVLEFSGYTVMREYYVNDAGRQMSILSASAWLRHWQCPLPKGSYEGSYLTPITAQLAPLFADTPPPAAPLLAQLQTAPDGDTAANLLIQAWHDATDNAQRQAIQTALCQTVMQTVIHQDMQALAVAPAKFNFFYETALHQNDDQQKNDITRAIDQLQTAGHLYQKDGALWFKSSELGDEKDRVIKRSNGEWTYFAADIAYHYNKLNRPTDTAKFTLINVLGADHHGYIPRLAAAVEAMGYPRQQLETQIIQFVALIQDDDRIKMSTRVGNFITVHDLVDKVKLAATRFFFISRKNDQHLDFDVNTATQQNNKNPIYYIQYAKARVHGILEKWGGNPAHLANTPLPTLHTNPTALQLGSCLLRFPHVVENAATQRAPHTIANYLSELAKLTHQFYEKNRVLPPIPNDADAATPINITAPATLAKIALLSATLQVIENGGRLLGIPLPNKLT